MNSGNEDPSFGPAPLRGAALVLRLILIAGVIALLGGLFLYAGGWFAPHALTPGSMIDRFETINGEHPGFRRNHAKGVCVSGYFEGNGNGLALSKASVFAKGRVPVIGRFAMAGGQPYAADDPHTVRSMALSFKLPDGEEWRTGINNMPVFPVKTVEGFYELLQASAPVAGTGKPDPAKMSTFFSRHPEAVKAMSLIRSYPTSTGFENSTFNSLNAFRFTNAAGASVPVRWAMESIQPFQPLPEASSPSPDKNALFDQLIASIHSHPLQWRLIVTVGQPGDPTSDASLPWPPDRQRIDAGTLTIDRIESEDTSPARDMNFDPLVLPAGIAGSDDPFLSARSATYAQSFKRREGEHKEPSAVSTAEVGK